MRTSCRAATTGPASRPQVRVRIIVIFRQAASRIPILPCFPNSFGNANTLASVQVLRTVCEDSTKSLERSEREVGEVSDRSLQICRSPRPPPASERTYIVLADSRLVLEHW